MTEKCKYYKDFWGNKGKKRELRKNKLSKEVKKYMRMISHKRVIIKLKQYKNNQIKIPELKNTVPEMKTLRVWHNSNLSNQQK